MYYILRLFMKKYDALDRRVNTFNILHTIEGTFIVQNLYEKTLKIYKFQNFEHLILFLNPKLLNKVPSDLFYDKIRLTKLSFFHSESEFVWEVPLRLQILKF
jgi:hypothetical protein